MKNNGQSREKRVRISHRDADHPDVPHGPGLEAGHQVPVQDEALHHPQAGQGGAGNTPQLVVTQVKLCQVQT